jgi:outer membrane protein TolC
MYLQTQANLFERFGPPTEDFQVQLGFDIPISSEPLITRAETQRLSIIAERDAFATQVLGAALSARAEYAAADRRWRAQAEHALPLAREAAELTREAYESGALDLTGALVAEQTRGDAELAASMALAARGRALANLEHALGRQL